MTTFLVNRFIKNNDNVKDTTVRTAYGNLAGIVGIVCNVLLFAGKLVVGLLSGSVAISADALNNLSDASSSVITLLGFKLSTKPPDAAHPYGYARIEYLSGLGVAVVILLIGVELVKTSINKIANPTAVEFTIITAVVLIASILLKLWMAFFNKKLGKKINSQTLLATSVDSRNDVIGTSAVLVTAIVSYFFNISLDGVMGLAVAIFILFSGVGVFKDTIKPLLGEGANDEMSKRIAEKLLGYDEVLGVHDLMLHDYGPQRRFASVHVEMAADADVLESHDVIDDIERDFANNEGIHLVIHFDPVVTNDASVQAAKEFVTQKLAEIDTVLSMHDFRMVEGPMHTNLIFDVVVPFKFRFSDTELREKINEIVNTGDKKYYAVITIDSSYAALPGQKDPEEEKIIHRKK